MQYKILVVILTVIQVCLVLLFAAGVHQPGIAKTVDTTRLFSQPAALVADDFHHQPTHAQIVPCLEYLTFEQNSKDRWFRQAGPKIIAYFAGTCLTPHAATRQYAAGAFRLLPVAIHQLYCCYRI